MMAQLADRLSTLLGRGRSVSAAPARGYHDPHAHDALVTLADGTLMRVPHANLAAAKELLAAQKAARRRLQAQDAPLTSQMRAERR